MIETRMNKQHVICDETDMPLSLFGVDLRSLTRMLDQTKSNETKCLNDQNIPNRRNSTQSPSKPSHLHIQIGPKMIRVHIKYRRVIDGQCAVNLRMFCVVHIF